MQMDDDFANMEDVSETCDEGQRPHEGVETIALRDTPLKRNSLASKNKSTYRGSTRRTSKANNLSPRSKKSSFQQSVQAATDIGDRRSTVNNLLIIENKAGAIEEGKTPLKKDKTMQQIHGLEATSPIVTQFAHNPYMDLKTKPSDAPNTNNFFSLLTHQNGQNNNSNNTAVSIHQVPETTTNSMAQKNKQNMI